MKVLDMIAGILLIIGGLNWGLVGLANYDIVATFLGGTGIDTLVYVLVGLSALMKLACCCCKGKNSCCS